MAPGVFPDCGCHYTWDDDGIHFCPLHKAAPDLLTSCEDLVSLCQALLEDAGHDKLDRARAVIAKAKGGT